jgi:CarD family transcriptional regulator
VQEVLEEHLFVKRAIIACALGVDALVGGGPPCSGRGESVFHTGDTVVYATHGVGVVRDIGERTILGEPREMIELELASRDMNVVVPLEQALATGLRPTMTKKAAKAVMGVLADRPEKITGTWSQRLAKSQARLKTGDPLELAATVRDMTSLDRSGRISYNERTLLIASRANLVEELSVVFSEHRAAVDDRVETALAGAGVDAGRDRKAA